MIFRVSSHEEWFWRVGQSEKKFFKRSVTSKMGVFQVALYHTFESKSQIPHFCDQFQSEANANENGRFTVSVYLTFQGKSQTLTCAISFNRKPMQMKMRDFESLFAFLAFQGKSQTPHFWDQFQSEVNANENRRFSVSLCFTFQCKTVKVRPLTFEISFSRKPMQMKMGTLSIILPYFSR